MLISAPELLDSPNGFKPWKYEPERRNIRELAWHVAYWKYRVRRYLDPEVDKGLGKPMDYFKCGRKGREYQKNGNLGKLVRIQN